MPHPIYYNLVVMSYCKPFKNLKEKKKNETHIREMEQTSKALVFLATVLCVAVLVTPGAAHDQAPTFPVDVHK